MSPQPKLKTSAAKQDNDDPNAEKRRYNSPLRQQQSAKTRQRIIDAGAELAYEFTTWDWKNLTFRAVSERAQVSERTVYRYFATEQLLKEAVIQKLVEDADIDWDLLNLSSFAELTARMFDKLSSFAAAPEPVTSDPSMNSVDVLRREALMDVVTRETEDWKTDEQEIAAAMLDMVWNPITYGRLITNWGFDTEQATRANNWLIGLIEDAVTKGNKP